VAYDENEQWLLARVAGSHVICLDSPSKQALPLAPRFIWRQHLI